MGTIPGLAVMKTTFEYVNFRKIASKTKTHRWSCCNLRSAATLGVVKWYAPWRRYCYFSTTEAVYSPGCLKDIQDFLESAMKSRKEERKYARVENAT